MSLENFTPADRAIIAAGKEMNMNHDIYTHSNGETIFLTSSPNRQSALRVMASIKGKVPGRVWAVPTPLTVRGMTKVSPGPSGESLCHRDIPPRTLRSPIVSGVNPFVRLDTYLDDGGGM